MKTIDREAFSSEMGLDGETVKTLYGFFAEELVQDAADMDAAARQRDGVAFARYVHKIKGTSASYHADVLYGCLADADRFCKTGDWPSAFDLAEAIHDAADAALREIASWQ